MTTDLECSCPFVLIYNAPAPCLLQAYKHGDDKGNVLCEALGSGLCSVSDLAALSREETFTERPQSVSISWINIH